MVLYQFLRLDNSGKIHCLFRFLMKNFMITFILLVFPKYFLMESFYMPALSMTYRYLTMFPFTLFTGYSVASTERSRYRRSFIHLTKHLRACKVRDYLCAALN